MSKRAIEEIIAFCEYRTNPINLDVRMREIDQARHDIKDRILEIISRHPVPQEAQEGVESGRCKYQEDNKNCTAKSCPYHEIRGTASDGTCILHPKPITTNTKELPKGRTCRSCLHTAKCKQLGIYNPGTATCNWDPCRYAEYHGDMTPEPMFMREVCEALGWQGGTVHDVIEEIAKLKSHSQVLSCHSQVLSRHPQASPVKEEPLAVDSIGCCPKCGVLLKDMAPESVESLEELAKRKGYSEMRTHWRPGYYRIEFRGYSPYWEEVCYTLPEVKSEARAYLNTLPDAKGGK